MKFDNKQDQKGFSILEIIAAITIIIIGMVGMISLSIQGLSVGENNQQQLVADQLAKEGIELIKNKRDSNWLAGNGWLTDLADGNYVMSYNDAMPAGVSSINAASTSLFVNADGFYTHQPAGGTATGFKRMLTVASSIASSTVTSLVQYQVRGSTKQYKLTTVLYDWK